MKKSLLKRITTKIRQPLNIFGWQIAARIQQEMIFDILKITEDPSHPQLFEKYKNVAIMSFFGSLPDLVDWALDSYRNGVALYKFPNAIKRFQDLEQFIRREQEKRRLNPFLRLEYDFDDDEFGEDLFID